MNTKTKKRLGIVSIVLVLLLAIGATAGTTLAKYISSTNQASHSATVAQWGYVMTASANLFGTDYDTTGEVTATKNGVISSNGTYNLVAPGAKGSDTILTISGTAETNAVLKISVSNFKTVTLTKTTTTEGQEPTTTVYSPIVWTVGTGVNATIVTASAADGVVTAKDVAQVIANKIAAAMTFDQNSQYKDADASEYVTVSDAGVITIELPAKTTIASTLDLTLSWKWDFSDLTGDDNAFVASDNDKLDTILGQIAYAYANAEGESAKTAALTVVDGNVTYVAQLNASITIDAVVAQTMTAFAVKNAD